MTPHFKAIHVKDALSIYDAYKKMGKPYFGHEFELIMTQHVINRINGKVNVGAQIIKLNKVQFESYMQIINHSAYHLENIK